MADGIDLAVKSPLIERLHRDWESRRRGRRMPARADFDPVELKYIVGNLSLVDVLRDPLRFRFRVHGSNIAARVGFDLTGKMLDTVVDLRYRRLAHDHYMAVVKRREPVLAFHDHVMVENICVHCEVLAMPLADDGETVDRVMTAIAWC